MPRTVTYKEPRRKPKPAKPGEHRKTTNRGWLAKLVDPDGEDPEGNTRSPAFLAKERERDKKRNLRKHIQQGVSSRKISQWERLEWVTDKIRQSWSHRRIILMFSCRYGMGKTSAQKYIERVYKDFQAQFIDPNRRNLVLAEHCAAMKEGMRQALKVSDLQAYNQLARQYAEIMGILTPAHLLKFHMEDNRQQVLVGSMDEAKATLATLEKLSEQDLLSNRQGFLEANVVKEEENSQG